jgi:adenosylcobinamide kinase/adenosylcobinamide-phosphate guanylyltransferase
LPHNTLILGGAASGKSQFAEDTALRHPGARIYIATAQAWDDEMRAKIAAHKATRAGQEWDTVEAPLDLPAAIGAQTGAGVILVDCVTMWLSNVILAERCWQEALCALVAALSRAAAPVVLVSNEVGQGIVPENALARRFRQAQGQTNQRLAAECDTVIAVMAGLPLALKGALP